MNDVGPGSTVLLRLYGVMINFREHNHARYTSYRADTRMRREKYSSNLDRMGLPAGGYGYNPHKAFRRGAVGHTSSCVGDVG